MSPEVCSFCSNANPHGSAFCNACGAALKLTLCDACEAINDRTAPNCHKCGAELGQAPPFETTPEQTSPADALLLPQLPIALAAAPSGVDELGPIDPSARSTWPRRRLSPAFLVLPVCAFAAVAYYTYQRSETASPTSATPIDAAIIPENSAEMGAPEGRHDEPKQSPDNRSPIVAAIPSRDGATSTADDEPALPTTDAGLNDGPRQSPSPAAQTVLPLLERDVPPAPSLRIDGRQGHKTRSVKREDSMTTSKSNSTALSAPLIVRPTAQRVETSYRPPAVCTDAVTALGLCSRNKPDQSR